VWTHEERGSEEEKFGAGVESAVELRGTERRTQGRKAAAVAAEKAEGLEEGGG